MDYYISGNFNALTTMQKRKGALPKWKGCELYAQADGITPQQRHCSSEMESTLPFLHGLSVVQKRTLNQESAEILCPVVFMQSYFIFWHSGYTICPKAGNNKLTAKAAFYEN